MIEPIGMLSAEPSMSSSGIEVRRGAPRAISKSFGEGSSPKS